MSISDHVGADKKVYLQYYQNGVLWYKCESGFKFPVPLDDAGDGRFELVDKSLLFMRWIRKHLQMIEEARAAQTAE